MPVDYATAMSRIVAAGIFLDSKNLAPATSGNYSMRLEDGTLALTVSGTHKGRLGPDDIMRVDAQGQPLESKKPSDEMALHVQLYRMFPEAHAILHVHSVSGVVLTRHNQKETLVLTGYEMLKVFPQIKTHDTTLHIPVVENSQDMTVLTNALELRIDNAIPAYLIRNHGFYVWGRNMAEAERIAEALEYLMVCEMESIKIKAGACA